MASETSLAYDIKTFFQLILGLIFSEPVAQVVRALDLWGTASMNVWLVRGVIALIVSAVLLAVRDAQKPRRFDQPNMPETEKDNNPREQR